MSSYSEFNTTKWQIFIRLCCIEPNAMAKMDSQEVREIRRRPVDKQGRVTVGRDLIGETVEIAVLGIVDEEQTNATEE